MRKAYILLFSTFTLFTASCSTLNKSLELGSSMGAATGAAATFTAHKSLGHSPSFESVALGAGVGAGIGLLTSYLTHREVEKDREDYRGIQTEMHFGDLPPSPFLIPQNTMKGKK